MVGAHKGSGEKWFANLRRFLPLGQVGGPKAEPYVATEETVLGSYVLPCSEEVLQLSMFLKPAT